MRPDQSKGMCGYVLLGYGEVCPTVVRAPFALGEDMTRNQVCSWSVCWHSMGIWDQYGEAHSWGGQGHETKSDSIVRHLNLDFGARSTQLKEVLTICCSALLPLIPPLQVLCCCYRLPDSVQHVSRIMEGTILEPPVLTDADRPIVSGSALDRWPAACSKRCLF